MKSLTNGVRQPSALDMAGNRQLLQKMSVDEVTEVEQRRPSASAPFMHMDEMESLRASDDSPEAPNSPKTQKIPTARQSESLLKLKEQLEEESGGGPQTSSYQLNLMNLTNCRSDRQSKKSFNERGKQKPRAHDTASAQRIQMEKKRKE